MKRQNVLILSCLVSFIFFSKTIKAFEKKEFFNKINVSPSKVIDSKYFNEEQEKLHVFIMAHADDWQLFLGEIAYKLIYAQNQVLIFYTTAGDAGKNQIYWHDRELAALKSNFSILGSHQEFKDTNFFYTSDHIFTARIDNTFHYFLRLPDGFHFGQGSKMYNNKSIFKLYQKEITSLKTVDDKKYYNSVNEISSRILEIINKQLGDKKKIALYTLDSMRDFSNTHSDHYITSIIANLVGESINEECEGYIFEDYRTLFKEENLSNDDYLLKKKIFLAYNDFMYEHHGEMLISREKYRSWLSRSYKKKVSCKKLINY